MIKQLLKVLKKTQLFREGFSVVCVMAIILSLVILFVNGFVDDIWTDRHWASSGVCPTDCIIKECKFYTQLGEITSGPCLCSGLNSDGSSVAFCKEFVKVWVGKSAPIFVTIRYYSYWACIFSVNIVLILFFVQSLEEKAYCDITNKSDDVLDAKLRVV